MVTRYVLAYPPKSDVASKGNARYVKIELGPDGDSEAEKAIDQGWFVPKEQEPVGMVVSRDGRSYSFVSLGDIESGKYNNDYIAGLDKVEIGAIAGTQRGADLRSVAKGLKYPRDEYFRDIEDLASVDFETGGSLDIPRQSAPDESGRYEQMAEDVRGIQYQEGGAGQAQQQYDADRAIATQQIGELSAQTLGRETSAELSQRARQEAVRQESASLALRPGLAAGIQALIEAGRADLVQGMQGASKERLAQIGGLTAAISGVRQSDVMASNVELQRRKNIMDFINKREQLAQGYMQAASDMRISDAQARAEREKTQNLKTQGIAGIDSARSADASQRQANLFSGLSNATATGVGLAGQMIQNQNQKSALDAYLDRLSDGMQLNSGRDGGWKIPGGIG